MRGAGGSNANWIGDFSDFSNIAKIAKADAEHATGFEAPLYNVWKQQVVALTRLTNYHDAQLM
jgi:hypothetical protein